MNAVADVPITVLSIPATALPYGSLAQVQMDAVRDESFIKRAPRALCGEQDPLRFVLRC